MWLYAGRRIVLTIPIMYFFASKLRSTHIHEHPLALTAKNIVEPIFKE